MYVQTLSRVLGSLVLLLQTTLHANPADSKRRLESQALHRRVQLQDVQVYSRAKRVWTALGPTAAKLRVVNLWSKPCAPCLAELPALARVVEHIKRKHGSAVQFLFVADPMDQTSAQEVIDFWSRPWADSLADGCPGRAMPHNGLRSCLIDVPNVDPSRSSSDALKLSLGSSDEVRPMTLLVDKQGVVRQAFVGSMGSHPAELVDAIELLLSVLKDSPTLSQL
jgi:thiol-disulfide isomerase/thioredoxin